MATDEARSVCPRCAVCVLDRGHRGPCERPGGVRVVTTSDVEHSQSVASACGHPQQPPTGQEIDGCPEIIVRNCPVCACELWWNIDQWRKL